MAGLRILDEVADYANWDKLINHCATIDELTTGERAAAADALSVLRADLGEPFLEYAFENCHPIITFVGNLAPWTRKWLTHLADQVTTVQSAPGYESVRDRLRNSERWKEGIQVLGLAYRLVRAGFEVTIDPQVEIGNRRVVPDLKAVDREGDDTLYIEAASMNRSRRDRMAERTMMSIVERLWGAPMTFYAGVIHKALSDRHLRSVMRQLDETVSQLRDAGGFRVLDIPRVMELGLASADGKSQLERWAAGYRLNAGELSGPNMDTDEVGRICAKIGREQQQLPVQHPSIVVVENTMLFLGSSMSGAINQLEEKVYEFGHLLMALVTGTFIGPSAESVAMFDHHLHIRRLSHDVVVDNFVLLLNRFCDHRVKPSTIARVYSAFRNF